MRNNTVIALLAVCATLLAVQVVSTVNQGPAPVFGQAVGNTAGADYVLATGMSTTGNNNMLFIFETKTQKLAASTVATRGIEFKGTRQVTWDLIPEEFTPRGKGVTVKTVKKAVKDLNK